MITTSSSSQTAQRSRNLAWPGDEELRIAALNLLQASSYAVLRRLRCEVNEAVATVHGVLPSYFLKQVAQTILQRLDGIQKVRNLVEVCQCE